jgi:lysozyme
MQVVLDNTTGDITPSELAALTDFTFNVGEGNFKRSTLLKLWNQGKHAEACRELPKWVYAGGVKLKGLVIRRAKEMALCLS